MSMTGSTPQSISLSGEVLGIAFRNADTDWTVFYLRPTDGTPVPKQTSWQREGSARITCVGVTNAQPGQNVTAQGGWESRGGQVQFKAQHVTAVNPTTLAGIQSYLASGVVSGIGAKKAALIVQTFGGDSLNVIENEPERLLEIRGVGPGLVARVKASWEEQRHVREILVVLHSQNISSALARRIYKAWGQDSIKFMRADPYRLCAEIRGVGFKTADGVAANLGIPKDSPQRIRAGLLHQMSEMTSFGHTGIPRSKFIAEASKMLEVSADLAGHILSEELRGKVSKLVQYEGVVYPRSLAMAEAAIATSLLEKACLPAPWLEPDEGYAAVIERAQRQGQMVLAGKQRQAAEMALTSRVCVISGGPGVGKTATTRIILAAMNALGLKVALAAPTGKAAQRLGEATGQPAFTVHRLLGLKQMGAEDIEKLECDVLLVDEASMLDVPLTRSIVAALGQKTALILVGDIDQLPSVGPGNVLSDIMSSGVIPVTVLDEVFRQAQGSLIITNAHAINRGELPRQGAGHEDFFMVTEQSCASIRQAMSGSVEEQVPRMVAQATAGVIKELVAQRIPSKRHLHPIRDIQVLSPMNKGECGVHALNQVLQESLNPRTELTQEVTRYGTTFRLGDKVIQTRNNYELQIFNGDMGIVSSVDDEDQVIDVAFEGRTVEIPFDDLDDLRLAYCISIHKSQGSQAKVIVMPMVTQHYTMLQRNLLYTGVTRAKELVVVVGQSRAIATAVSRQDAAKRISRLGSLLAAGHPALMGRGASITSIDGLF